MLSDGSFTSVSDIDFWWALGLNWCPHTKGYVKLGGGGKYMHQLIGEKMGFVGETDHRDRDKRNNQRPNLRSATSSQNHANTGISKVNTSGFKGVHWSDEKQKWMAKIQVKGKSHYLGYFDDPKLASDAYMSAARFHFGEFA